MRRALREVEARTGQQIFRKRDDAQLDDSDLVEAWSHLSLSLYVGRSARGEELAQGFDEKGYRRTMMELLGTEAGPALRSQRTLLEGVYRRAAALNGLKKQGVLDAELESTLAWQLGLEGRRGGESVAEEGGAQEQTEAEGGTGAAAMEGEVTFSAVPGKGKGPRGDKPSSWEDVKPGHLWKSAKKFLPKLKDLRPDFHIKRGGWEKLVGEVATWLKTMPPVTDPWGSTVVLANPQDRGQFDDPMQNRAAHLIGHDAVKGQEDRSMHYDKLAWLGAVRQTISDAQVRVVSGNKAETLYFRNYKEGTHMVVTANGVVKDQQVLITQYAPELSKQEFQGAVVEKTQPARQAPQGSPGAVGIRAQPQPQAVQTPQPGAQGDLTAEGGVGQAENVVAPVPGIEAGFAAVPSVDDGAGATSALDAATISAEDLLQGGGRVDVSARTEAAPENVGPGGVALGEGGNTRASRERFARPSRSQTGGLAYSRTQGAAAFVAAPEARKALDTIRHRLPGLLHQRVLAFDSPADLAASSYGEDYSASEVARMEGAEALFDRHTKRTLLFLGQVEQRPGETPLAAVARVLVHERMGHEGVNFLLETDADFAATWNNLAAGIPQAGLDAILDEPGYAHLAEQPQELALEWMARQIEASEGPAVVAQLNGQGPGLAQRMWQALRDALSRVLGAFSGRVKFDLELNDLIRQAREAALDGRTASQLTAELDRRASELEVRSPLPEVIRLASPHNPDILLTHGNDTARAHQDRNPGRALERLRRGVGRGRARSRGKAGRVPGGSERRSGDQGSGLPRIHAETLERGIAPLKKLRGAEHDVYQHLPSNLAIKLTRPGEFGWGGNIQTYLRRLAWINVLFDDDVAVAGLTQLPGESLPRLVTTQPWYRPDKTRPHPNAAEIQTYMRAKGFLKVADEGYVHEHLDIYASDAKPDNFIRTTSGLIRPIDLILGHTDEQEYRRLRDLAEDLPQMPGPDRSSEETGPGDRLQFSQASNKSGPGSTPEKNQADAPAISTNTPSRQRPQHLDSSQTTRNFYLNGPSSKERAVEAAQRDGGRVLFQSATQHVEQATASHPGTSGNTYEETELGKLEATILQQWAERAGLMMDGASVAAWMKANRPPNVKQGGEHQVAYDAATQRGVKVVSIPMLATSTVYEYLTDHMLANRFLGDQVELEGFFMAPSRARPEENVLHIVVSQPWVKGSHPDYDDIVRHASDLGMREDPPNSRSASFEFDDPVAGTLTIMDAKSENWIEAEDGTMVPIDIHFLFNSEQERRDVMKLLDAESR